MDDALNRLARELADAIAAAVTDDRRVEACREHGREQGFEMSVSLEAVIGFKSRTSAEAQAKPEADTTPTGPRMSEMTANDRRFLRSLRIAADEATEEVE